MTLPQPAKIREQPVADLVDVPVPERFPLQDPEEPIINDEKSDE